MEYNQIINHLLCNQYALNCLLNTIQHNERFIVIDNIMHFFDCNITIAREIYAFYRNQKPKFLSAINSDEFK